VTDPRELLTEIVHRLLAEGRADTAWPRRDPPVLSGWPTPSRWSREYEQRVVATAIPRVKAAVERLDLTTLASPGGPSAISFDESGGDGRYRLLPLVYACLDPVAHENAMELLLYRFGKHSLPFWETDVIVNQDQRLNGWACVELNLWDLARDGGLGGPPPYALRVDLARWFWSDDVPAPSMGLCLRCGERQLRYRGNWRVCRRCSRGEVQWPLHATEPAGAGKWVLLCITCLKAFVGDANARRCPEHRLSRNTPSTRRRLRADEEEVLSRLQQARKRGEHQQGLFPP
jgi:hypothetical protein